MTNAWDEQLAKLENRNRDRAEWKANRQILRPSELRKKTKLHCTPRRRGPAKINFPMAGKKFLMLLTGTYRTSTLKKAERAFMHYAITKRLQNKVREEFSKKGAEKEMRDILSDDLNTLDEFKIYSEDYVKWPRRNFDANAHRKRLSKILSQFDSKNSPS